METSRGKRSWPARLLVAALVLVIGIVVGAAVLFAWGPWREQAATPIRPDTLPPPALDATTTSQVAAAVQLDASDTTPDDGAATEGVYRYATTGGESIDAVGGASRTYPDTTLVVVEANGCGGETLRWLAAEERTETRQTCDEAGLWRRLEVHNEWFGVASDRVYECTSTGALTARCSTDADTGDDATELSLTWTRGGEIEVVVDGAPVPGSRTTIEGVFSGATEGSITIDQIHDLDGVLLQETKVGASTTQSLIGPVSYEESYSLTLVSRQPVEPTNEIEDDAG